MNMNQALLAAVLLAMWGATAGAAETAKTEEKAGASKPVVTVTKREDSGVSGMLSRLWSKLRAASPKIAAQDDRAATQVAGVRGAEATDTALQPYWKDDKEADPVFVQQANAFKSAQQLADAGSYAEAAVAFDQFIVKFPDSQLKPNAEFGSALAYMSAGNGDKGKIVLQQFVAHYPQHPLANDAKSLLTP